MQTLNNNKINECAYIILTKKKTLIHDRLIWIRYSQRKQSKKSDIESIKNKFQRRS